MLSGAGSSSAAFTLLTATIAFAVLHSALGLGGHELHVAIRDYASSVAYILVALIVWVRAIRIPDVARAVARARGRLPSYGAGNLVWALWLEHVAAPPIPSICDVLWLSLYPLALRGPSSGSG